MMILAIAARSSCTASATESRRFNREPSEPFPHVGWVAQGVELGASVIA
jgi:hypothetical protein